MPWQEVTPMDLRLEFTRAYASGLYTMTELCDQYAISRKTGYKWVDRYEAEGRAGLADRSRRPHRIPRCTDSRVVASPVWNSASTGLVPRRSVSAPEAACGSPAARAAASWR